MTNVKISGNSTVTANFAQVSQKANLLMAASPATGGTTTPVPGVPVEVNTGELVAISAVAADGCNFMQWFSSGNATLDDPNSADTNATLTGDATVTAYFSQSGTTQVLLKVQSDAGGTVTPPGENQVTSGVPIPVSACLLYTSDAADE